MDFFDSRQLDGEPHEVADASGKQAQQFVSDALVAHDDFAWAARGAWMTAEYHRTGEMPDQESFASSPIGRSLTHAKQELQAALKLYKLATASVAWNPRAPLTGE